MLTYVSIILSKGARNIGKVKIALWPDYTNLSKAEKVVNLGLLKGISFIVPIHSMGDLEIVDVKRKQL